MTPAALADLVRSVAHDVLTGRGLDPAALPEQVTVRRPGNPEHGDYSTNLALLTAPATAVSSRELAGWFAEALTGVDGIGDVQVAGAGFLNVRLAADGATLREVLAGASTCGSSQPSRGRRVSIAVRGADPAGRANVHRSALVRLLAVTGAEVLTGDDVILTAGPVDVPGGMSLPDAVGTDFATHALLRSPLAAALTVDPDIWSRRTVANPAFHLQYAHARAVAVTRVAAELGIPTEDADPALLIDARELILLAELADVGRIVDEAAACAEPDRVLRQLERIAEAFLAVQDGLRLLPRGDDDADGPMQARLLLVDATRSVIASAAGVLGLSTPEQL